MKYQTLTLALLVTLIGLPRPTLAAWPLTLHDDGGPYRALAVASRGGTTVAAVATPTTVELTATNGAGDRIGWTTLSLPTEVWQAPRRLLWISVKREYVDVVAVAGDEVLSWGSRYRVPLRQRRGLVTFGQATSVPLQVPAAALDMAVASVGRRQVVVWRTQSDDGIATVRIARLP